ncbi:hydroxymethylpyrimidine kinase /phosphomethylpyrimidine kinase [Plasticicumulans lactativorans]|uniref:hydroxymethylpyrimidine kinase n=1 Tax=Plasticicumulans lactativorans TaxID=1133106 RepID=A0A4R2LKK8_9GAMM|nr:bifunctional hydroxymethylpyrimidine kinase/phosphomethylpyrimidine kinase [Plasticicumulans lactativorans]TCO83813.1 hydroxymethylpyrimidine kinase /phosphomethylpyrimidine kinase [Plasticicumulans lactativorans]
MIPNVLTIAGSDPSGGAGIQADLKTFSALGAFGTSVITALTAQNTRGVTGVHAVPAAFVREQLDTLFADVAIAAVKIGMLADPAVIDAVAEVLERKRPRHVVLDPVMVAKSGDRLLPAAAVAALRSRLLPLADLITPNLPEAADLLGLPQADSTTAMERQAAALRECGARGVLLKGGHLGGPASPDLLWLDDDDPLWLPAVRVDTRHGHGTGCTLSAAIAALRPRRPDWPGAVRDAKAYVGAALAAAGRLEVGGGCGPVHHFHALWPAEA